jgi:hypothetical protein
LSNIFTRTIQDIEGLWKKEEPVVESAINAAVKAVEPVWKTALGQIVMSTVTNLQSYAASQGGAAAAKLAAQNVATASQAAGISAAKSTVNTLIELAVTKLSTEAATLGQTAAAPAAPTS